MSKGIRASLFFLLVITGLGGAAAQSSNDQSRATGMNKDVPEIKEAMLGSWESIAPEVRPSANKNPDGSFKPFYLKRAFKYQPSDRFELEIVNSADPYGAVPLARIKIGGHMLWQGPHPIAPDAQKVDFVADESYEVTPLAQGFCGPVEQGRVGRLWAVGSEHAPKCIRKSLRSLRSQGRDELHGVRPRLPQGRPAVLGRPEYRRPRL